MNGGGIPGGPMPMGAAAIKPGGIAPAVKPIVDAGGKAGGGIMGAVRELGESWNTKNHTCIHMTNSSYRGQQRGCCENVEDDKP